MRVKMRSAGAELQVDSNEPWIILDIEVLDGFTVLSKKTVLIQLGDLNVLDLRPEEAEG